MATPSRAIFYTLCIIANSAKSFYTKNKTDLCAIEPEQLVCMRMQFLFALSHLTEHSDLVEVSALMRECITRCDDAICAYNASHAFLNNDEFVTSLSSILESENDSDALMHQSLELVQGGGPAQQPQPVSSRFPVGPGGYSPGKCKDCDMPFHMSLSELIAKNYTNADGTPARSDSTLPKRCETCLATRRK